MCVRACGRRVSVADVRVFCACVRGEHPLEVIQIIFCLFMFVYDLITYMYKPLFINVSLYLFTNCGGRWRPLLLETNGVFQKKSPLLAGLIKRSVFIHTIRGSGSQGVAADGPGLQGVASCSALTRRRRRRLLLTRRRRQLRA